MTLRIGVDLDGVIYDFSRAYYEWVVREHNVTAPYAPPVDWYLYKLYGFTEDEFLAHCHAATDAEHLFLYGDPVPEAVAGMRRLRRAGRTLHIVTARDFGPRSQPSTLQWLKMHEVPYDTITFSYDKTVVDVDMFIDDKPSNVDALRAKGVEAYLINDQGREDQKGHPYYIDSWAHFEDLVVARERLVGAT